MRKIDLTNHNFNNLTVLKETGRKSKSGDIEWLCKCSCGNLTKGYGGNIKNGHKKSCGCLRSKPYYKHENPEVSALNSLFTQYQQGAKARNFEFNIDLKTFDYLTQQKCNYCNFEGKIYYRYPTKYKRKTTILRNGLDRLDSKKGYTLDNIVPCCTNCNYFKSKLTLTEFITHITKIYENFIIPKSNIK